MEKDLLHYQKKLTPVTMELTAKTHNIGKGHIKVVKGESGKKT